MNILDKFFLHSCDDVDDPDDIGDVDVIVAVHVGSGAVGVVASHRVDDSHHVADVDITVAVHVGYVVLLDFD